jgi:hypothetical protein
MGTHPGGADDAEKRKRDDAFPGLNPELAALHGNGDGNPRRRGTGSGAAASHGGNAGRRSAIRRSDAEMAAEVAAPDAKARASRRANGARKGRAARYTAEASDAGRAIGLFALAIAIASLFVWALPLGLTAAALGWYSFREGARGLGVWSVVLGLAAALSQLVLIPIQAAW